MLALSKGRFRSLLAMVSILVVIALVLLFAFSKCGKEQEQMVLDQDYIMEIVDIDLLDPRGFAEENLPVSEYSLEATLYIADGPGRPGAEGDLTGQDDHEDLAEKTGIVMHTAYAQDSLVLATLPIKPIQPIYPIPIDPPSTLVKVLNPAPGSQLIAGSNYTLKWTVDSVREITVDILFSADGGSTYQEIVTGIPNENAYQLKVPTVLSESCVFRVNALVGTVLLGYSHSPTFQVVAPPTPKPPPPVEPLPIEPLPTEPLPEPHPVKEYPPSSYMEGNNAFINENEDATRWFTIEHELTQVDRVVWQISRIPFPCERDQHWSETPGLLAWGFLDSQVKEFPVDFNAIMGRFKEKGEGPKLFNRGVVFETVPDIILLEQVQRVMYVRAIMLDEQDRIIGATRSEFQFVYGKPIMEQAAYWSVNFLPDLPRPELSMKDASVPGEGQYKEIRDKGVFIYAAGNKKWSFMLEKIPRDSVEIDLQISTLPYKYRSIADFQHPAGLVYRSRVAGLSYTTTTRYYPFSFADFAPPFVELGINTITYYVRAVCYVPGEGVGTVVPIVSKTHQIHYTGDQQLYLLGKFDFDNLPPEEVEVRSYVPTTEFKRYIPARWPLDKHEEYFEVTRPIQAEEISFYIKNHATGDFLYPYPTHMHLYPQTTRQQYQAIVDRMLPPGAWFRLTITQSNWDALWNEFCTLLNQIYGSIQQNYNGLKNSLANLIADRFAFLGSDVQSYIRTAVRSLIDYGLISVGLPPSLPNFAELTDAGLDYCVQIALQEAAQSMGIPPEQIPAQVKNEIVSESKSQLKSIGTMSNVNPLNVGYLKPATQAMYRPAWVDVNIRNPHDQRSPSGTLTISYYPVGKPHFKLFKYVSLPIPSLAPKESTFIRVHLRTDNTHLPVWKEYYWGNTGECVLNITATYHVPDVEIAAKEQGAKGISEHRPDAYVYDVDPVFSFKRVNKPCDPRYN